MNSKINCWEFKKCGRQAGGELSIEFGVCSAYTDQSLDGIHGGKNAGRSCWVVAGTFCGGEVQGMEAQNQCTCWTCDFFQLVKKEEAKSPHGFSVSMLTMQKLQAKP